MKTNIVIALCATFLFVAACKKKEEGAPAPAAGETKPADPKTADTKPAVPKTTEQSAETKLSEPAVGGAIASSADYESKAMAAMDKMTAIFAAGGKDCDKVASEMIKFVDENETLIKSAKAWEKDHPDEKKVFDTKVKAKREDFMAKAGPTMQACKDHKGFKDATSAIERANRD